MYNVHCNLGELCNMKFSWHCLSADRCPIRQSCFSRDRGVQTRGHKLELETWFWLISERLRSIADFSGQKTRYSGPLSSKSRNSWLISRFWGFCASLIVTCAKRLSIIFIIRTKSKEQYGTHENEKQTPETTYRNLQAWWAERWRRSDSWWLEGMIATYCRLKICWSNRVSRASRNYLCINSIHAFNTPHTTTHYTLHTSRTRTRSLCRYRK